MAKTLVTFLTLVVQKLIPCIGYLTQVNAFVWVFTVLKLQQEQGRHSQELE